MPLDLSTLPDQPAQRTSRLNLETLPDKSPSISIPSAIAKSALGEATRLPRQFLTVLPQLLRTGASFFTGGYPAAEEAVTTGLIPALQREDARNQQLAEIARERPIASGVGSLLGSLPSFALAAKPFQLATQLPAATRLAASIPGQIALRSAIGAGTFAGTEALQLRPQAIPGAALTGGLTFPLQAIPNAQRLPSLLRAVPRAAALGTAGAGLGALTAPEGERTSAAIRTGGLMGASGFLPAFDPLAVTKFDTPQIIAARARQSLRKPSTVTPEALMRAGDIARKEIYGTGAASKEKVAVIVLGPPASGKSTVVAEPLAARLGAVNLDNDRVKAVLARELGLRLEDAPFLHDTSSDVVENLLLNQAVRAGDNIVLPLLGKTKQKFERKILPLLAREGYKVHLVLNELPIEKATQRGMARFLNQRRRDPAAARFVPPETILSVRDQPMQTYEAIRGQTPIISSARLSVDVPRGTSPKLVEMRGDSPVANLSIFAGPVGRENLVRVAVNKTLANKGVTLTLQGKEPTEGFVVAALKANERVLPPAAFTEDAVSSYLKRHEATLQREGHHFGTWYDEATGKIFLDTPIVVQVQSEAEQLGRSARQQAIWDVRAKQEIPLHGENLSRPVQPPQANAGGVYPTGASPGRPAAGTPPDVPPTAGIPNPPSNAPTSVVRPLIRGLPTEAHDVSLANKPTKDVLEVAGSDQIKQTVQRLIHRDPADSIATGQHQRLFLRIADAIEDNRLSVERDFPDLAASGFQNAELAHLFRQSATYSGQTLNRLSQIARRIKQLAPELDAELRKGSEVPPTIWTRIAAAPRQVVNLWRASLVSQLATAVRNFAVFHQRYAFRLIEDAANAAYETAAKTTTPRQSVGPLLEDLLAYGRAFQKGNRQRVLNLLAEADPLIKERLIQTPVSDVALSSRYAKLIGTFNNAQEYFARTIVADAVLAGEARRGAPTLTTPIARKAVDRALDMTFAKYPRSRFGREFVKAWNNPILNVLTYPFPRYLTNSVRAIWEHSPAGAMRLLDPKYHAILRSGDPRAAVEIATKAALGSAMFAAASWIRDSQYAGERWYEVRKGQQTIDVRPYGPLLPVYLFVAELIKTGGKGFEPRDYAEGVLGINRMAGTTLFLTSVLAGKNPDTMKRKLAEFTGQFAGGFTVPLRTFQDFVAQFSKEEATIRDVKQQPLTGPARANIPGASRQLPSQYFPTRAGTVQREQPGVRQLTGATQRTKNVIEQELDRLGISNYEVESKVPERLIKQAIARRLGELAERDLPTFIQSPAYQALSDEEQREVLLGRYSFLRARATKQVTQEQSGVRSYFDARRQNDRAKRQMRSRGRSLVPALR